MDALGILAFLALTCGTAGIRSTRAACSTRFGLTESRARLKAALSGDRQFAELPMVPPLYVPGTLTLIDLRRTIRRQHDAGRRRPSAAVDEMLVTRIERSAL